MYPLKASKEPEPVSVNAMVVSEAFPRAPLVGVTSHGFDEASSYEIPFQGKMVVLVQLPFALRESLDHARFQTPFDS
jgi:hypothetical protein